MKKVISKMNIPLLLLMLVYSVFGLIMIFSASSDKKLLLENIAPEIISRATGLSLDEIEKINAGLPSFQQDS